MSEIDITTCSACDCEIECDAAGTPVRITLGPSGNPCAACIDGGVECPEDEEVRS